MEFSQRLFKEKQVAAVPGTAFGTSGEGYVRMAYTLSLEKLREALNRIEEFVNINES
jgi:aminotransferase